MSNSEDGFEDEVCQVAESLVEVITSAVWSDDDLEQVKILIEDVDDAKVRQETLIIWVGLLQTYNDYGDYENDDRFEKLASALKSAGESRQAAIVGRLLDICPDQEAMRKICTGELLTACKNLNVPMVEVLLFRGVNPYSRHNMYLDRRFQHISPIELSLTEFYRATEKGLATTDNVKVINLLLDKKEIWAAADQSDTKVEEATVLLAAVVAGRFDEAMQLIIDRGVDVNAAVELGDCGIKFPLGEACRQRDVAFFKQLLSIGANPYVEASVRNPSLFDYDKVPIIMVEAISRSDTQMIEIMLNFDDALTRHNYIRSVAMFAAFTIGDTTKQKLLAKWCIKEDEDFIDTQLFLAIREENVERVKALLPYVTDINRNFRYGDVYLCTPLEAAMRSNKRTDICDLLIENGAKVNLVSAYPADSGYSPLMVACIYNQEMVPHLLERGADVNLRCKSGTAPLDDLVAYMFEKHGNMEYIRCACLLLREGAEPSASANLIQIVLVETFGLPMCDNFNWVDEQLRRPDQRLGHIDYLARQPISQECTTEWDILELVKTLVETGSLSWRLITEVYLGLSMKSEAVDVYLKEFLANGYTLKEMCRLKIREVMRPPLRASIMSDDFYYPLQLKKYILLE